MSYGLRHWALNFAISSVVALMYLFVAWRLSSTPWFKQSMARARLLKVFVLFACAASYVTPVLGETGLQLLVPQGVSLWFVASWFFSIPVFAGISLYLLTRMAEPYVPERRRFLRVAGIAAATLPSATAGVGVIIARGGPEPREVDIHVPGLPKDLNGLRLTQLSDIHYGPFLGTRELERAISIANEFKPHVSILTGDLITRRSDDLEDCIRRLSRLKSDAGVFGCHGNHEIYADAEALASALGDRHGIRFLRQQGESLRFGSASINLVGYDYQVQGFPYLEGVEALVRPDEFNLLLSHNPDVFDRAQAAGMDLVLSGHTHGGQVNVEILHEQFNLVRFVTPYVYGLYDTGKSRIYVNGGLGTVGVPMRLGVPPEVTLIRLCAV